MCPSSERVLLADLFNIRYPNEITALLERRSDVNQFRCNVASFSVFYCCFHPNYYPEFTVCKLSPQLLGPPCTKLATYLRLSLFCSNFLCKSSSILILPSHLLISPKSASLYLHIYFPMTNNFSKRKLSGHLS